MSNINNIIDTHIHVWDKPVHIKDDIFYTPNYTVLLEQMLSSLQKYNVKKYILVQPSFQKNDNTFLLQCLQKSKNIKGIINFDDSIGYQEYNVYKQKNICGVRFNFLSSTHLQNKTLSDFKQHLEIFEKLNYIIEIQANIQQYAQIIQTIQHYNVTVIADHMLLCTYADKHHMQKILPTLHSLNFYIKISAPYRIGIHAELMAKYILKNISPLKIIWGSDFPHTRFEKDTDYQCQIDFINHLNINATDKNRILYENAQHIFGF